MEKEKILITNLWTTYGFECPQCGECNEIGSGDFLNADTLEPEDTEWACRICKTEYLVKKPEGLKGPHIKGDQIS